MSLWFVAGSIAFIGLNWGCFWLGYKSGYEEAKLEMFMKGNK